MKAKDLSSQEVEPYDFTSTEYDLSMTDGNDYKYINYLQDLRLNKFVSFWISLTWYLK